MNEEITKEEVLKNWGVREHYLNYLVDILNKKYDLNQAIEDIKSFRKSEHVEEDLNDNEYLGIIG